MEELMLKVNNVSKEYRLGVIGGTTLKESLQRTRAKILHKPDPTLKIGEERTNEKGFFQALKDISFEVKKGEAVGIIGHNGAGKSTLLKLITQVTAPTSGEICLNGRVASMLEVGTGFHPELTGRENIYLNGAILGMSKKEIDAKIEDIIEFSECRQFIDTPVKRYSSGMYVKLAFSVAANLDSEIMIMDEVLAVGDVAFQNKCINKMKDIAASGRTILYVSHNMGTIRALCSRVLVLNKGQLIFDGDVEEGIEQYVKTAFLLEPIKDLSNLKRAYTYLVSNDAHMTKIAVNGKEKCVFKMGEKLDFELFWTCKKNFENMSLRIGVWTVEGNAIAISYSNTFNGFKGKENETNVELDISNLLPGKYSLEIIMNQLDGNGGLGKHDVIKDALNFEIIPSESDPVYYQCNKSWGYIKIDTNVKTVI